MNSSQQFRKLEGVQTSILGKWPEGWPKINNKILNYKYYKLLNI